jgi:PhoD related phosphatase
MSAHIEGAGESYQAPSKSQRAKLANGAASKTSQPRRPDQEDLHIQTAYDDHLNPPPAAPEVPRGPPISYRQPYGGESIGQPLARSFSQRAKGQMLAQEALEDDEYWDDNDNIPSQTRIAQDFRNTTEQNYGKAPVQNGVNSTSRNLEVRREVSEKQPQAPTLDSPQSTPKASRYRPHSLRHSADVAPLNLDLSSPTSQSNSARAPRAPSEAKRRGWAPDRSPLQTLEVKLNDISKEEKRARVEEAEMLLRESKAGRGGRRSSREVPATLKKASTTKEPPLTSGDAEENVLDQNLSQRERNKLHRNAHVDPQTVDLSQPPGKVGRGLDAEEQQFRRKPVSKEGIQPVEQTRSRQLSSRNDGQTHPAHGVSGASSSGKPRTESLQDPTSAASAPHPAHDPRPTVTTGHPPDEAVLHPDQRRKRLQNEVRRATSARQPPVPQSIPSNITRAVSLQQHQPQPLFPDDQDLSRSGPMRESNSSHKAALAEATAAIGAAGATAATSIKRDNSRKLQKAPPGNINRSSYSEPERPISMDSGTTQISASAETPRFSANTSMQDPKVDFYYRGMPKQVDLQISNSQRAPEPVQTALSEPTATEQNITSRPRQTSVSFKVPFDKARPVNEWKQAGTARLTLGDLALDLPSERDQAWWEMNGSSSRRRSKRSSGTPQVADAYSQEETKIVQFRPPLYLKCGPLLRYTGMKRDRAETQTGQMNSVTDRETWRGSVMIVTHDSQSSYEEVPTLRLFSQPRDLLPPPPQQVQDDDLAPEYVDPIAGLTKVSRRGQTLYVKPVDHLEEGKDLSRIENDDGLFETSPSPLDNSSQGSASLNKRTRGKDGESLGKYREVKGARLYTDIERDVTFWRFNIEVELGDQQAHIAYRINRGPPVGFWVPGKGQTMNIMFHSCNGFSLSVNPDQFSGPDPLWRDVLNTHQTRPFHVMIGGGDQLYNDRVMVDTQHFAAWTHLKNPIEKHHMPFTDVMGEELESFYLNRYSMWFSQGLFGLANSQIPMVNIYDDHDIIDGFGSYPDDFQRAPVFMGIGNIAFKYYMLFQHQSVPEETQADEPSWLLGARPGPYIQQLSRSVFVKLGRSVAFLGLDCRTEREVRFIVVSFEGSFLLTDFSATLS